MRIIPAIDIIEGKCVRLTQGNYSTKKIYNKDPLEVAKEFQDYGIRFLHLVDLDGAKSRHIVNHRVLEKIALGTNLNIDFGGGMKSDQDLRIAFECGASQVTGGSIAVKDPEKFSSWIDCFGAEKIILGTDARNEEIVISGWSENSGRSLLPTIKYFVQHGAHYIICTDVSKDGMLEGPSIDLYRKILQAHKNIKLIASGGITTSDDLFLLQELGCEGAIIGKAIYEGQIPLKELERFVLNNKGKI